MEQHGWINPMHPRPLYVAEALLYLAGAGLAVLMIPAGFDLLRAVCALVLVGAGFGLASELRVMWVLALGACILAAYAPATSLLRDPAAAVHSVAVLDLAMLAVVAGALLHPETRAYRVRWLR